MSLALMILFGLVGGSFLGLGSYRLPRGLSVVRPGSRCPGCERGLPGWENIPLLSFVLQRGRCRGCGQEISWRYPLMEAGVAAAFGWSWQAAGGDLWFCVRSAFFLACLLALAATDWESRQLPDEITLGAWAVGLAMAAHVGRVELLAALVASCGGAGLLAVVGVGYMRVRGLEGLGWGDVKMVGMLGAFLGIEGTIVTVLLASLAGAAVGGAQGLAVLLQRRGRGRSWKQARARAGVSLSRAGLPLGVFLAAAGAVIWLSGGAMWRGWLG
ncbi:MAG: prepilin peptidase [Terriglobales bacterium]